MPSPVSSLVPIGAGAGIREPASSLTSKHPARRPAWPELEIDMTTPASEDPQSRSLASYETGFWAFLEYPVFWLPVIAFTFLGAIALIVLMITGAR
jgi:hypothetical protein